MPTNTYKTEQRNSIIECFKQHKDKQLTAKDISEFLMQQNSKIGLATVYRNLDYLEKNLIIKKYVDESGKQACYQFSGDKGNCNEHYHLKCEKCGKITHLQCNTTKKLDEHILTDHHFVMNRGKTIFYGICDACIKNEENKKNGKDKK